MLTKKLSLLALGALLTTATSSLTAEGGMTGFRLGAVFGTGAINYVNKDAIGTQLGHATPFFAPDGNYSAADEAYVSDVTNSKAQFALSGYNIGVNLGYLFDMGGLTAGVEAVFSYPMLSTVISDGRPQASGATAQNKAKITQNFSMQFSGLLGWSFDHSLFFIKVGYSMNGLDYKGTDNTATAGVEVKRSFAMNGVNVGFGADLALNNYTVLRAEAMREMGSYKLTADDLTAAGGGGTYITLGRTAGQKIATTFNSFRLGVIAKM